MMENSEPVLYNNPIEDLKFLTNDQVRFLGEKYGTPLFVYDEETIKKSVNFLLSLPNPYGLTIRYSIKALPNRYILRIMDSLGLHFDASSEWEARRAIAAGIEPSKILLTSQELGEGVPYLIEQGVQFDAGSLSQLENFGQMFPGKEVSIRINPGFGSGLVNRLTSGGPQSSFGIWHEHTEKINIIINKYNLNIKRIHSHIGSGHNPEILINCLDKILELCDIFKDVKIINLGGGYKVKAFKKDPVVNHEELLQKVSDKIILYNKNHAKRLHIELEPGTFLVANAGSIISKITDVTDTGREGYNFIKINSGLTEIIRPSFYGTSHPLVVVHKEPSISCEAEKIQNFCVVGHCCIAGDILTTQFGDREYLALFRLPECNIGDYLVIERSGGYCSSMCLKNFNSYPESPEILKKSNKEFVVIRKRQTIEQVFQNEII